VPVDCGLETTAAAHLTFFPPARGRWGIPGSHSSSDPYRFLGDAADAEDVAQEAFLRVLDSAERYQPTASFRPYLDRTPREGGLACSSSQRVVGERKHWRGAPATCRPDEGRASRPAVLRSFGVARSRKARA